MKAAQAPGVPNPPESEEQVLAAVTLIDSTLPEKRQGPNLTPTGLDCEATSISTFVSPSDLPVKS